MLNILLNILLKILLAMLILFGLSAAGIIGAAVILQIKRPLRRIYRERTREEDFCPLKFIPETLIRYVVMIEDDTFLDHPGFSIEMIRQATRINREKKTVVAGGSTMTQQLVKNLYFEFVHSYIRKAIEIVLAIAAERKLRKTKILELYMNIVYFGNGIYGITDAARFYFNREVQALSRNQMFMLACMLYAPTRGNPIQYPDRFEIIRNRRIKGLLRAKMITEEEAALFSSYSADCLDPDLRQQDDFTRNYPQDIMLVNERFGPHSGKRGAHSTGRGDE